MIINAFMTFISLLLISMTSFAVESSALTCKRIISQSPYITHQLDYLGLAPCIVGASRYDAALALPDTGGIIDPDAQKISQLHPDLWITSQWTQPAVYQTALPKGTQGLRLDSFNTMAQISDNLIEIAQAVHNEQALVKAKAFASLWQHKIAKVQGNQKRILLLSSCGKQPYAYGKQSWLGDLFSQAGFSVIDFPERVTHLGKTHNETQTLAMIQSLHPELIAVFHQSTAEACELLELPSISQLIILDGNKFLHPAPILLDGIDQLITLKQQWQS